MRGLDRQRNYIVVKLNFFSKSKLKSGTWKSIHGIKYGKLGVWSFWFYSCIFWSGYAWTTTFGNTDSYTNQNNKNATTFSLSWGWLKVSNALKVLNCKLCNSYLRICCTVPRMVNSSDGKAENIPRNSCQGNCKIMLFIFIQAQL